MGLQLRSVASGRPHDTVLLIQRSGEATTATYLCLTADGHYRAGPGMEQEVLYVVQVGRRQETLTPAEFGRRHGWKNDPERVNLK